MNVFVMWRLLHWARNETSQRGITIRALLADLREQIDPRVLGDAESKEPE